MIRYGSVCSNVGGCSIDKVAYLSRQARAIGNGWAIPDTAWIFARIDALEKAV